MIQQHEEFFNNQGRITALKELLEPEDRESKIRLKTMSIVCSCDPEWEKVVYSLFGESFKKKQEKLKAIEKYGLNDFLWETIEKKYSYRSPVPTIKDFLVHLFQDNFERSIPGGKPVLSKEAYLFVNRWKENTKARSVFSEWSMLLETELGVENNLQEIQAEGMLDADTYPAIDKKIILSLREHIAQNTLSDYTLQEWIEKRKVRFFYNRFEQLYNAFREPIPFI